MNFYKNKVVINDNTSKWHRESGRLGFYHLDVYGYIVLGGGAYTWKLIDSYDFDHWSHVNVWLKENVWKNRTFIKNNTLNSVNFQDITLAKPWEFYSY